MTAPLAVRLHDDVAVGSLVVRGGRVLRLHPRACDLLAAREVVATDPQRAALVDRLLDLDLAAVVGGDVPSLADVTLVVPLHDDPSGLDMLLSGLDGAVPSVVVDDASADPAAVRRVAERHGARLVRLEVNEGPAAARNRGLAEVATPLVAFADADVVIAPGALTDLLADLADPRVALVAPRVRTRDGRRWFERYEDAQGALDLGPAPATVRPTSPVSYVPSACLVGRVSALGDGFDPTLRSGEDVDLVWRLIEDCHRVRYRGDVPAWHRHRATAAGWLARRVAYGASAAPLTARHGSRTAPAVLSGSAAAMIGSVAVQRPVGLAAFGAVLCSAWRRLGAAYPESTPRQRLDLVGFELRTTARQASGLALRHGWPATIALAAVSRRARRAAVVLAAADAVLRHRATRPELDLARFAAARRLDDLAYGAGVWLGAARARSAACLRPARWVRRSA
jgi:mycofactocin system glycosyltransferase